MHFLTISSLRLNKCILSKLEKDGTLFRDNYGTFRKRQKLDNGALPEIISSGQKITTVLAA